jgi:iron complex outermembrane receptor protein
MKFLAHIRGRLRLGAIVLMAWVHLASARTSSDQDLMSLNIEELTHVKVYSASRHMEGMREAPSAVSIITAEDIRHYGWRTLGEALRSLRGFYTSYDRHYTFLGVRGVMRPGDYNARILVQINGHRVNENIYSSAPMGTEFSLDLDLIDHIEVIRGPGSSLYGTNAVFGGINIITRHPGGESAVEVSGDSSSFLSRGGRVTGMVSRGRLNGVFSGSLYRSDGPRHLFFPEFASSETNYGFADNSDGDHYGHAFSDISYGNFRVQGQFSRRAKTLPSAAYGINFNDPTSRSTDSYGSVEVEYRRTLASGTDLDVRAYYDADRYRGIYALGGTQPPDRVLYLDDGTADWTGLEVTAGRQLGKHHITAGADYEYNFRVDQEGNLAGPVPLWSDHRTPWRGAVFGEAELSLLPKVTLHAGGRFDYFDAYDGAFSPRLALVYLPNSRTALKYIYGGAFRAPNAFESYYADGVTTELPSGVLKKESIESHELVWERALTPWLGLTANAFYNKLDNLIDYMVDPATGMTQSVNVGADWGRGLEVELGAKRASGVGARASYALADARNDTQGGRLANSPLHQAKLNTTLPVKRHAFAGVELLYTSAQGSYRETRVPSSFLTNLTLSTRPLWGGWELSGSCYNLFNQGWWSPMGPMDQQAAIRQDGRTYRFKLSYRLPVGRKRGDK